MWYVRDVLYAVLFVRVSCFVVRGCAVSRRYINVCNCDMFGVAGSASLCCVCGHVVVFGMSVRLSWYPMWMRWWCCDCDACTVVCVACVSAERV